MLVGKDILELVSSAMYVDPLTIYREYVQNAADSIDDARRTGVLKKGEPGRVDIHLMPAHAACGCVITEADFRGRSLCRASLRLG